MHHDVQPVPVFLEPLEHRRDVGIAFHVAGQGDGTAQFGGRFFDPGLQLVVLVGKGKFGAFPVHRLGDAPGDGTVAGDSHDQGAFAGEKAHNELLWYFAIVWTGHSLREL